MKAAKSEDAETLLSSETAMFMALAGPRGNLTRSEPVPVWVDRERAAFSAWYELFPRSQGDPGRHGTLRDVIGRLDYVADLGFDVLYFPPIHPIGTTNRKGKNNALRAEPGDVGSPYAIGSPEGGMDAIHPELGTLEDFDALVEAAHGKGLGIALDIALNASPDTRGRASTPTGSSAGPTEASSTPRTRRRNTRTSSISATTWRMVRRTSRSGRRSATSSCSGSVMA